jgi:hypothetical protein
MIPYSRRLEYILSTDYEILVERKFKQKFDNYEQLQQNEKPHFVMPQLPQVYAHLLDTSPIWNDMLIDFLSVLLKEDVVNRKSITDLNTNVYKLSRFIFIMEILTKIKNNIITALSKIPFIRNIVNFCYFTKNIILYTINLYKFISLQRLVLQFCGNKILLIYKHYLRFIYYNKIYKYNSKDFNTIFVNKIYILFTYYNQQMQGAKQQNVLTLLHTKVKYYQIDFQEVLSMLNNIHFFKVFKLSQQIMTINKVIDTYVSIARLNKSHSILKVWKLMNIKVQQVDNLSNSLYVKSSLR